jgi:hypothetical protein
MIPNWRLVFATTYNDKTVDTFDASIQDLTRYINKAGQLRATIAIPNADVGRRMQRIIGSEGRMSVYAYRNEILWWGGFVDGTRVEGSPTETVLLIEGTTYESYLLRRECRVTKTFTMDQAQIMKTVWEDIQDDGIGTDILVETARVKNTGITKKMPTKRSDARTWESYLAEVANSDNGFEWIVDTFDDGIRRRRELTTGYPQIGRPAGDWTLSMPGAILQYAIDGSALDGATSFQARGKAPDPIGVPGKKGNKDGTGGGGTPAVAQDPIMSDVHESSALHKKGYTRMDATVDRSTVTDKAVLNQWAKMALQMRQGPLVLPEITCRIDDLTAALLGYNVRIRIRDTAYPAGPNGEPGYEGSFRVIGLQVDPGEQGYDDIVKLVFENPHSAEELQEELPYAPEV